MKKLYALSFLLLFLASNCIFTQSNWNNIFFNNVNTFSKIIKRDSSNYLAVCFGSKYFYKSSDAGNNWESKLNYTFDSAYSFIDAQFIDSETGWLVGWNYEFYDGAIFKTTNGGINWVRQNTGYNIYGCRSVCFLNSNTGWIGSSGGTVGYLLKTTNGGTNWTKQDFQGVNRIEGVKFFDNNNGWILGHYGFIARTTDGGQIWVQKQNNIYCTNFSNLCAISLNECWVLSNCVGQGMVYSHFYKTTNSGDNWNLIHSYTDSLTTNGHSFWRINFSGSSVGYLNGDFNFIFKTSNAGLNWNRVNVVSVPFTYAMIGDILPLDSNNVFAAGGYSGLGSYEPVNYILKSTNSGTNWNFKSYNYHYRFYDIHFKDPLNGLAVCDTSQIFKTTDNGSNWSKTFNDRAYKIGSISFSDNNNGNAFCYGGKILRTTNYGNNWFAISSPTTKDIGTSIFINSNTGFVIGNNATVLKSIDGGNSWNINDVPLSDSFQCVNIDFIDDNTGWILANRNWGWGYPINIYYRNNKIIKTTNTGVNWITIYDSTSVNYSGDNYHIIKFFDNNNGLMILAPGFIPNTKIMKTSNGGANWFISQSNLSINVNKLEMYSQNIGWMGGTNYVNGSILGALYKTTNGGNNWYLQFNEGGRTVRDICILDSNKIFFSGDKSSIYYSTNGGGGVIGIEPISHNIPNKFYLIQNYPNPFNPVTKIKFDLPKQSNSKIIIYDLLGREVATLVNEQLKPGSYEVEWDGSGYSSGVYFYSLQTESFTETKRMVLIK